TPRHFRESELFYLIFDPFLRLNERSIIDSENKFLPDEQYFDFFAAEEFSHNERKKDTTAFIKNPRKSAFSSPPISGRFQQRESEPNSKFFFKNLCPFSV